MMVRREMAAFPAGAVLLCLAACSGAQEKQQAGALQGEPWRDQCGFDLAPARSSPLSDPCTAGSVVLPMETYPREAGAPHAELRTFTLYEPGAICVLVESRSVSSARIGLDSTTLVSPDELSPQVHRLTAFANLAAGEHELSVELASGPGHQLEVEVRFARTDVTLSGGVEGAKGKLVVGALASEPDPFTPANHNGIRDVTNLNAMVKVLQLTGGPHHTYFLGYAFEIADPVSCSPVRLLAGQVPLDPTHRLAGIPVAAEWDGKDEEGNLLPDGTYLRLSITYHRETADFGTGV